MTVSRLNEVPLSVDDLRKLKVVTVEGSTSALLLDRYNIPYKAVTSSDVAVSKVRNSKSSAFVYDEVILDYYNRDKDYVVSSIPNSTEYYGIVFPQGSTLREKVNQAILKIK